MRAAVHPPTAACAQWAVNTRMNAVAGSVAMYSANWALSLGSMPSGMGKNTMFSMMRPWLAMRPTTSPTRTARMRRTMSTSR